MLERVKTPRELEITGTLASQLKSCIASPENALCIPPICYSSDEHLARETEMIFRNKWIGIGHAGRFKQAGDYETMDIGGVPIIVLRDKESRLRAFANSCRHRSARLLDGEGNCSGIRCPFHSWAYKLDGTLAGVPHIDEMPNFDRSQYGLIEFRAAEIAGLGFVCLNKDTPPVEAQVGDLTKLHSPWPMDTLVPTRSYKFEVQCNWKTFLDVFNEYYHLPFVHPDSIDSVYAPPSKPDTVSGEYASQYGETDGTGGLLENQQEFALPDMAGLDPAVSNGVRYTWVFPNMAFAAGSDALWIYEANPIDANRSMITQTACFEKETTERPGFAEAVEQYYIRLDAAIAEDIPALENQQLGLKSPFAEQGRFSPNLEANVASFANWYARTMLGN